MKGKGYDMKPDTKRQSAHGEEPSFKSSWETAPHRILHSAFVFLRPQWPKDKVKGRPPADGPKDKVKGRPLASIGCCLL